MAQPRASARTRGAPCPRGCRGARRRGGADQLLGEESEVGCRPSLVGGDHDRRTRRRARRAGDALRLRARARGAPGAASRPSGQRLHGAGGRRRGGPRWRRRTRRPGRRSSAARGWNASQGAVAADEAHAAAALVPLVAEDDDHADLRGRARMGAPAGLEVESLRLHQPHRLARLLGTVTPSAAASARETTRTVTGRPSQMISFARRSASRTVRSSTSRSRSMVDSAAPRWKLMVREAFGDVHERAREEVLAVVLLAVVAAARRRRPGRERAAPSSRGRSRTCRIASSPASTTASTADAAENARGPRAGRRSPRRRRCGRARPPGGPRARAGPPRGRRTPADRDRRGRGARSWAGARPF